LKAILLREQAHEGRTLIQKFEDHSNVGFAVVLVTGDDQGGLRGQPYDTQKPRARQNVIFELGYFRGKLGPKKVCALYETGVELPTDYEGVGFVKLDDQERWHLDLAKEMKAAKLPVDLNKL
jgi:predicted nucleotide-binding protein